LLLSQILHTTCYRDWSSYFCSSDLNSSQLEQGKSVPARELNLFPRRCPLREAPVRHPPFAGRQVRDFPRHWILKLRSYCSRDLGTIQRELCTKDLRVGLLQAVFSR